METRKNIPISSIAIFPLVSWGGDDLRGLWRCDDIHDDENCFQVDTCRYGQRPSASPGSRTIFLPASRNAPVLAAAASPCARHRRQRPRPRTTHAAEKAGKDEERLCRSRSRDKTLLVDGLPCLCTTAPWQPARRVMAAWLPGRRRSRPCGMGCHSPEGMPGCDSRQARSRPESRGSHVACVTGPGLPPAGVEDCSQRHSVTAAGGDARTRRGRDTLR